MRSLTHFKPAKSKPVSVYDHENPVLIGYTE